MCIRDRPQVVPVEDAEIGAFARKAFEKQGMKIITSAKVTKVEKGADSVTAHIEDCLLYTSRCV